MPKDPYVDNGRILHVYCDWKGPEGLIEAAKDFIWDTGASASCVTPENARGKGLAFLGLQQSFTHAGPVTTPTWGGGTMTFNVRNADGSAGAVNCSTVVAESDFNILGQDQMDAHDLTGFKRPEPVIVRGLRPPPQKP